MGSPQERAKSHMLSELKRLGFSAPTVDVIARVPRERLVPRFWIGDVEYIVGAEPSRTTLDVLFDADRAVAVKPPEGSGAVTSTASATRVLAAQLDLLAIEPGMRVFEIGTGPGYFAAVLAEAVGSGGQVVSIDIDAEVAAPAADRLAAEGYDWVQVLVRDGHAGVEEIAPFDRVVASVGCVDVSAAWLAQLAPEGFVLAPLLLGGVHPMVLVGSDGTGHMVSRSGYVAIQGAQSGGELWPYAPRHREPSRGVPLPKEIKTALRRNGTTDWPEWDLGAWLAIHDQRAIALAGLADETATARIQASSGAVLITRGDAGRALAAEVIELAQAWLDAGAPRLSDYSVRFVPIDATPSEPIPGRRWVVTRVDHHQILELDRT